MALPRIIRAQTNLRYDTGDTTPISRRNAYDGLTAQLSRMDVGDPVQGNNLFCFRVQEEIEVTIPSAPDNPSCSVCPMQDGRACRHIWRINDFILGRSYNRDYPFRLSRHPTGSTVKGFEEIGDEVQPLEISFYDVLFVFEAGLRVTSIFNHFESWKDSGTVIASANSDVTSTAAAVRKQTDSIQDFMQNRGRHLPPSQRKRIATVLLNIMDSIVAHDEDYTLTVTWTQANFSHVDDVDKNLFTNLIRSPAPSLGPLSVVEALESIQEVFEDEDGDDEDEEDDGNSSKSRLQDLCERLRQHEASEEYVDALASLIDDDEDENEDEDEDEDEAESEDED